MAIPSGGCGPLVDTRKICTPSPPSSPERGFWRLERRSVHTHPVGDPRAVIASAPELPEFIHKAIPKKVATAAMSLPRVHGPRTITAKGVLARRYRLQMIRVHAVADSAQMVNDEARRDGADRALIGEPMGAQPHALAAAHPSIPIGVQLPFP